MNYLHKKLCSQERLYINLRTEEKVWSPKWLTNCVERMKEEEVKRMKESHDLIKIPPPVI